MNATESTSSVSRKTRARLPVAALIIVAATGAMLAAGNPNHFFTAHNLVSDGSIAADHTDANLVNAWGIAFNPTGVWWVNDNHSGLSTLYDGTGAVQSLVVTVPTPQAPPAIGSPTGIVFSGGTDFIVSDGTNSAPARFIFASEDGTISAWSPVVPPPAPSTVAHTIVDNSDFDVIYKGLALAATDMGNRLYATDFHNRKVDVFDGTFTPVIVPGGFHDCQIPQSFAPFGIAAIDGKIYVTFAKQDADGEDDVAGPHLGYVDVFDVDGHLLKRLIKKGRLNAPWGLALAPSDFGRASNRLLVGNFGDGTINVFNINSGNYKGTLKSSQGHPIVIEGLWGLGFGNGGAAGATNTLFFSAGPGDEEHGLFGCITANDPNDDDH